MHRYQDYQACDIPVVEREGARVRVMAGESGGARGPIELRNPGLLLDVTLDKGASFTQEVTIAWQMHSTRLWRPGEYARRNAVGSGQQGIESLSILDCNVAGGTGMECVCVCG
jgi:hypothetical protein